MSGTVDMWGLKGSGAFSRTRALGPEAKAARDRKRHLTSVSHFFGFSSISGMPSSWPNFSGAWEVFVIVGEE